MCGAHAAVARWPAVVGAAGIVRRAPRPRDKRACAHEQSTQREGRVAGHNGGGGGPSSWAEPAAAHGGGRGAGRAAARGWERAAGAPFARARIDHLERVSPGKIKGGEGGEVVNAGSARARTRGVRKQVGGVVQVVRGAGLVTSHEALALARGAVRRREASEGRSHRCPATGNRTPDPWGPIGRQGGPASRFTSRHRLARTSKQATAPLCFESKYAALSRRRAR